MALNPPFHQHMWRKRKKKLRKILQCPFCSDFCPSPFILLPKLCILFFRAGDLCNDIYSASDRGYFLSPSSVQWVWAIMRHPGGGGRPATQIVPCPHSKAKTQKSFLTNFVPSSSCEKSNHLRDEDDNDWSQIDPHINFFVAKLSDFWVTFG